MYLALAMAFLSLFAYSMDLAAGLNHPISNINHNLAAFMLFAAVAIICREIKGRSK